MRLRISIVGVFTVAALLVSSMPVSAARQTSFAFTACFTSGGGVQTTTTWSGFKVDAYDFGFGQFNGQGAGFYQPIKTASSGVESTTWASLSNNVELVGGGVYYQSQLLQSGTVTRPSGGWSRLPSC